MFKRVLSLTLLGLVIGSVVSVLAVWFVEAVLWLNKVCGISAGGMAPGRWWVALVPAVGGLAVGFLSLSQPGGRFHGPVDAIRAAQSPEANMSARSGVVSALAACLSLGAGASVGQYGPLVHLGASFGSWIRQVTGTDRALGTISIACGAAAAISAAFHAPIAGLVFSHEVILRHYSLRAFAPIAVASTVAYVITDIVLKRDPLFQVTGNVSASAYEYFVFIVIGISGALLATAYMRAIEFAASLSRKLNWPAPVKTGAAGLALGIVAVEVPEVLGIGQEVLRHVMAGDVLSVAELAQILVAKTLLTALCVGFGFAGGVFSPALLIGSLFGALVGTGAAALGGDGGPHVAIYAVCGLVAVTGPTIGAPLATVLIVFELTQSFDLATAALISVAFANLIAYRAYGRSLFDIQLERQGFDLSLGRNKVIVQQHTIREVPGQAYTTAAADDTPADVRDALLADRHTEAYVVDDAGVYVGTIDLQEVLRLIKEGKALDQPAASFASRATVTLHPDTTIWDAMSEMEGFIGESIPVLDDGMLVGALSESAIVGAYLAILEDLRREEHAAV